MGLATDLQGEVDEILRLDWNTRQGQVVPESGDVTLGNEAVTFDDAVVIYADLKSSTAMVDAYPWTFAAEAYKRFLLCAARAIRSENGDITAYDGDRIMAIFIGELRNTRAVRAAMKITFCVDTIINPTIRARYNAPAFVLQHVTGIDRSPLKAARTGVRGANDLVWIGRAANYAAKLAAFPAGFETRITDDVRIRLPDELTVGPAGEPMWEAMTWTTMNNFPIHRSRWWWRVP